MKKTLGKLSLSRETLRLLENAGLKSAGGVRAAEPPDYTSDITNCYICPVPFGGAAGGGSFRGL